VQTDRNGEHEWARLPPPWAGEERVSQFTTLTKANRAPAIRTPSKSCHRCGRATPPRAD